jgi:RNA polymerase sigma factor (sigma-70 family)
MGGCAVWRLLHHPNEPVARENDPELVAAAQADAAAFDQLFARYADPVLNYCYYRLGTWEEAEDATQQVFVNAYTSLHRFRGQEESSFRSWLFTIAHHEVVNRGRASARRRGAPLDAAMDVTAAEPSPEELAIAAEQQGRVLALLNELSSDQRRVIELRLAGLTDGEIGQVLARSPGAVRAVQARAVANLRALLSPHAARREAAGA